METILEQMRVSRTSSAVEKALDGSLTPVSASIRMAETATDSQKIGSESAETTRLLEQQTHLMRDMATVLHMLALRDNELRILSDTARKTSEENARLREEMWTLRHRLETTERMQQEDLEQLRACMGRLTGQSNNDPGTPSGPKT